MISMIVIIITSIYILFLRFTNPLKISHFIFTNPGILTSSLIRFIMHSVEDPSFWEAMLIRLELEE